MRFIKSKSGVIPAILGTEVHYAIVGLVIGIALVILLLILGNKGILPLNLCKLLCACKT